MSLSIPKFESAVCDQVTPDEWKKRVVLPTAYLWVGTNHISLRNHGRLKAVLFGTEVFRSIRLLELVCRKQRLAASRNPEPVIPADDIDDRVAHAPPT